MPERVALKTQIKEQPQAESKNINKQNEKSKTKEARDPSRSRVQ